MSLYKGFLTDDQREQFNAETRNAENLSPPKSSIFLSSENAESTLSRPPAGSSAARHLRRSRSHSGKPGRDKKDGAGGRGTWGNILDTGTDSHVDRNDPNYDSSEEPYKLVESVMSDPLDEYKKSIVAIIEEYFNNGEVELAASDIEELDEADYLPYFIKCIISIAMDRHDKEKEMTAVLLSSLYGNVVTPVHIAQGFYMLLDSSDDLAVDIPNVADVLALFMARAVVDDILPPVFLTRARRSLSDSSEGARAIEVAQKTYLSAPHHAELVECRWGGSTRVTVEKVKKKMAELLREYIESGDSSEARRCIRELGVPFFHHEVVKKALILSMEVRAAEPLILRLLRESAAEGLISSSQMSKGFSRLYESVDDLALDIPSAKTLFRSAVISAVSDGWLDSSFSKSIGPNEEVGPEDGERLSKFKAESLAIIREYFLSDDIPELIQSLVDMGMPEYNPVFLKKLVTLAMDRRNREKEMASVLVSALHMEIFTTEDVKDGFVMLLESAEDTALDVVDASGEMALFLARAVVDEVLAPLNLEEMMGRLPPKGSGAETVVKARRLVGVRHGGERVLRCWGGGGTGRRVEDAKEKIKRLLEEYESGGVVGEACRCIRDLGLPFFNHEVVHKSLVMAMEKKKDDCMLALLDECFNEGLITTNQMAKGFARVRDGLDDLSLDIPNARLKFSLYLHCGKSNGWIPDSLASDSASSPC